MKEVVLETTGMRREAIELLAGSGIMRKSKEMISNKDIIIITSQTDRINIRSSPQN